VVYARASDCYVIIWEAHIPGRMFSGTSDRSLARSDAGRAGCRRARRPPIYERHDDQPAAGNIGALISAANCIECGHSVSKRPRSFIPFSATVRGPPVRFLYVHGAWSDSDGPPVLAIRRCPQRPLYGGGGGKAITNGISGISLCLESSNTMCLHNTRGLEEEGGVIGHAALIYETIDVLVVCV